MRFSKILNYSKTPKEKELIQLTEEAMTSSFLELSTHWHSNEINRAANNGKLGGDPLQMQLIIPLPHIADLAAFHFKPIKDEYRVKVLPSLRKGISLEDLDKEQKEIIESFQRFKAQHPIILTSAGTDGRCFYWEPCFFNSKSRIGRRLLIGHESGHALLTHPSRCMGRNKNLWNIAIDFKVNYLGMQDLKARGFLDAAGVFRAHLGDFISLNEYAAFIQDPYHPSEKMKAFGRFEEVKRMNQPGSSLIEDEVLAEELPFLLYGDSFLPAQLLQPEAIYDFLWRKLPVCKCCGKISMYKKPKDFLQLEQSLKTASSNEKKVS